MITINTNLAFYVKILISIIGIIFLIDSASILMTGYNSSKVYSGLFGLLFIMITFFWNILEKSKFKSIYHFFLLAVTFFLVSLVIIEVIIIASAHKRAKAKDAVIVLGAGLRGTQITLSLAHRLDTAYAYLKGHPDAVAVVTGGQGPGEDITEAVAMREYLVEKGIAKKRVLIEDKATSTYENFKFSKQVLDQHFKGSEYTTAYITNTFHIYRSGLIAAKAGIPSEGVSAPTVWYTRVNYYLREYLAVIKFFVLGR